MSCQAIDDIWRYFEQLESEGKLSVIAENYILELKFFLRFVRAHVKQGILFSSSRGNFYGQLQSWIEYVEVHLIQSTRKGSIAADVLEEILAGLLLNVHWLKENLYFLFSDYYQRESCDGSFAYQDVLIVELLMDWFDPVLENLKHLIHCGDLNLLVLPVEHIKELQEKLIFFRNFLEIFGMECRGLPDKTIEDLFSQVKFVIGNAIYLSYLTWMHRKIYNLDKFFFDLLVKINHIESNIRMSYVKFLKTSANLSTLGIDIQVLVVVDPLLDNLWKLLKEQDTASVMPLNLHQIEFLHQELSFLKSCLQDPCLKQYADQDIESFNYLLIQVESMARQGTSLTHSVFGGQLENQVADEMNLWHSSLLEVLNLLKAKFRQMYLKVPKPSTLSFPQTPKSRFLETFMQRLDELLNHGADSHSLGYMENEIKTLRRDFASLISSLRDIIENPEKDEIKVRLIMNLAYEAEHVIDSILTSHYSRWYYMLWFSDFNDKVKLLRNEPTTDMYDRKTHNITKVNVEKASVRHDRQGFTLMVEDDIVGFKDEVEKIINQLGRGPKRLDIVSIVGMAGLGKTTLARKVYEHPTMRNYFHVRAWYCVSQVYEKRDLLFSILGDITGEKIHNISEEDAEKKLYQSLRGKRYLIVMDDIWSIKPWNEIRNSFPNDCNGSRILFTSRIREVALEANPKSAPNDLRLFSYDESWELLQKKVLWKGKSFPERLRKIGEKIAWRCKGLPFLVVAIAGTLRTSQSEDHWKQILESLDKQVISSSTEYKDLLELSYKHLPDHMKPCFLYLGAFPEDKEITAWKLIRLWIAEGLVQETESESLEVAAEGYLEDLVSRNLVLISKNKCSRGIKSCHLHDLWHEFLVEKAKDEKFFLVSQELVDPEQYRHCFYCPENWFYGWKPNYPNVRSMLCFPTKGSPKHHSNLYPADLSVLPYVLKLLRVLDLERINVGHQFPKIEFLVHLRYLAIRGSISHVPSSIGKLWRLETLIMKGTTSGLHLPGVLLEMASLKHVYAKNMAIFELRDSFQPGESFKSDVIEKFSTLVLFLGDGTTEKVMSRLRSLRKLKCIILESQEDSLHCSQLPLLDLSSKLESLSIVYSGKVPNSCEFISFPSNLKKLTLSMFRFPWSSIFMIGRLPQLEILKLRCDAFVGQSWIQESDDEFQKLRILKLENLDFVEWDASPDAFPCLEQLVLCDCGQLKEIPSSFGELATLRMIHVQGCTESTTETAERIIKEQEDLGIEGLQVLLQPEAK